jgi:hypothetical protein
MVPRRQAKSSPTQGKDAKIRELLHLRLTLGLMPGSEAQAFGSAASRERDSFAFRTAAIGLSPLRTARSEP